MRAKRTVVSLPARFARGGRGSRRKRRTGGPHPDVGHSVSRKRVRSPHGTHLSPWDRKRPSQDQGKRGAGAAAAYLTLVSVRRTSVLLEVSSRLTSTISRWLRLA